MPVVSHCRTTAYWNTAMQMLHISHSLVLCDCALLIRRALQARDQTENPAHLSSTKDKTTIWKLTWAPKSPVTSARTDFRLSTSFVSLKRLLLVTNMQNYTLDADPLDTPKFKKTAKDLKSSYQDNLAICSITKWQLNLKPTVLSVFGTYWKCTFNMFLVLSYRQGLPKQNKL